MITAPHVHTTLSDRWLCRVCPEIERPTTPDHIIIDMMGPNDIFVFGSNTLGIHGKGAAKTAKRWFGARHGVGEGLIGNSYALPTLYAEQVGQLILTKRTDDDLYESMCIFYNCADDHPGLLFWLTRVGCGLASYEEAYMIELFSSIPTPTNILKPEGW